MTTRSFTGTLAFGAAAALAGGAVAALVPGALSLAVAAIAVAYAALLGTGAAERLRAAGLAAGPVGAALLLGAGPAGAALAGGLGVAVARSRLLELSRPARTVAAEVGVGLASWAAAAAVAAPSPGGVALAVWAAFLGQSTWFLLGDARPRPAASPSEDPFQRAVRLAAALLGEEPGRGA